jgi:hypothetical protein
LDRDYFINTSTNIIQNQNLREPQIEAYVEVYDHFITKNRTKQHAIVILVFCKTFLHNIAKKKYTPLRLKFFSDYFGLDRAFLSRKLSPVKLKMCA